MFNSSPLEYVALQGSFKSVITLGMSRRGVNLHNLNGLSRIIRVITGGGRREDVDDRSRDRG